MFFLFSLSYFYFHLYHWKTGKTISTSDLFSVYFPELWCTQCLELLGDVPDMDVMFSKIRSPFFQVLFSKSEFKRYLSTHLFLVTIKLTEGWDEVMREGWKRTDTDKTLSVCTFKRLWLLMVDRRECTENCFRKRLETGVLILSLNSSWDQNP